jgi:hypothetical protein
VLAFHELEKALEKETVQAEQSAAQQLDALAAGGNPSFQEVYARARDLLGDTWPHDTLAAMPGEAGDTAA